VTAAVSIIATAVPATAQPDRPIVLQLAERSAINGISDVGDGSGLYQTLSSELVAAELRNDVNFFVDLGSNKTMSSRDICVDLSVPAGNAVPRGQRCTDMHWNTAGAGSLSTMLLGETQLKRMQLYWTDSDGTYYLRWGSNDSIQNWVTVTCVAADTAACSAWTLSHPTARASLSLSTRRALLQLGDYEVPVDLRIVAR
jgi:hypothetical protein